MKWTDEEIEDLKLGLSIGLDIKIIADILDRTESSIRSKQNELRIRLNTANKTWTKKEIDKLKSMYKEGVPKSKIAILLNRTIRAIGAKLLEIGLKEDRNFWSDLDTLKLKNLLDSGLSYERISIELNRTVGACQAKAHSLGFKSKNILKKYSNIEYIDLLSETDYNNIEKYINMHTPILHKHTKCGNIWKVSPNNLLRGRASCPLCANYGFNQFATAYTYLIYFNKLDLYKVGISNDIKSRFSSFKTEVEVILLHKFKTGKEAKSLESVWLKNIKEFLCNTNKLPTGNTETFRYE